MRPSHSHTRATLTTCLPLLLFLLHLTNCCSCLGQSAAHSLSTTTVRSSTFNIHTRIPPTQSTALTLRRCRYQHLQPTDAIFQENASKSCCHTSDASNPTVGATTPNAVICPNHTCLAVWIGTYTKVSLLHKNVYCSVICVAMLFLPSYSTSSQPRKKKKVSLSHSIKDNTWRGGEGEQQLHVWDPRVCQGLKAVKLSTW